MRPLSTGRGRRWRRVRAHAITPARTACPTSLQICIAPGEGFPTCLQVPNAFRLYVPELVLFAFLSSRKTGFRVSPVSLTPRRADVSCFVRLGGVSEARRFVLRSRSEASCRHVLSFRTRNDADKAIGDGGRPTA